MRRSGLTRTSVYTKKLPDTYKSTDITDDSAIVTLPPSFDNLKKGKPYSIERPSFKMATANAIIDESKRTADLKNIRSGLGNNTLFRDSFRTPSVIGRQATDFALQELIDQQQQGIKVQLSDKTLNEMFQVATPDDKDVVWIAEYNRRLAGGETKEQLKDFPPYGRAQRTIFKSINFAQGVSLSETTSNTVTEELGLLKAAVTAGSGSSDITDALAKIFKLTEKIDTFSTDNYNVLGEILNKMNVISPDPSVFFGAGYHRLWDKDQYLNNQAKVVVFLTSNTADPKTPVIGEYDTTKAKSGYPATLQAMYTALAKDTRVPVYNSDGVIADPKYVAYDWYLDVVDRKLITRDEAIALVSGSLNIDNGQLGGLDPPPIKVSGGIDVAGTWNTPSEDDKLSKASTSKPSGSSSSSLTEFAKALRAIEETGRTLSDKGPPLTIFKESDGSKFQDAVPAKEINALLKSGDVYGVIGKSKLYRRNV